MFHVTVPFPILSSLHKSLSTTQNRSKDGKILLASWEFLILFMRYVDYE